MIELTFGSLVEMQEYFESDEGRLNIHKKMFSIISQAVTDNKKTLKAFSVYIEDLQGYVDISVPKSTWYNIIQSCLRVFEEFELSDEAIDCYLILKKFEQNK